MFALQFMIRELLFVCCCFCFFFAMVTVSVIPFAAVSPKFGLLLVKKKKIPPAIFTSLSITVRNFLLS